MNDISKILQEARNQKGWSIEELSDRTKIRKGIIKNIEEGNFEDFQEVYLRAYIRSLAKELKIYDTPEFIAAYEKLTKTQRKEPKPQEEKKKITIDDTTISSIVEPKTEIATLNPKSNAGKLFKNKPKININILIYTVLFLFLGFLLFVTFYPMRNNEEEITSKGISVSENEIKKNEEPQKSEDNSLLRFFQKSDSLRLNAQVTDSVWINILIDKKTKVQSVLMPNQNYSWSAAEEFKVTHGNAKAIKFWLNDKELEPFAPPGYIAKDVIITRNEIINPNFKRIDSIRKARKKKQEEQQYEFRIIEPSPIRKN